MIVAILSEKVVAGTLLQLPALHIYGERLKKPWTFKEWSNSVNIDEVDSLYFTFTSR